MLSLVDITGEPDQLLLITGRSEPPAATNQHPIDELDKKNSVFPHL